MTERKQLQRMRKMFLEGHWTQHASAKNERGMPVPIRNKEAVSFCLTGAGSKLKINSDVMRNMASLLPERFQPIGTSYLTRLQSYNDSSCLEDVVELVDKTITEFYPPPQEEVCQPELEEVVSVKVEPSNSKSSKISGKRLEELFPGTNTPDPTMEPEPLLSS